MDLSGVLSTLVARFTEQRIDYALIGGFALGLWGVVRATVDLDFLVLRDDLDKLDQVMKDLDYKCAYRSDNVSQYLSPLKVFGEVDVLHAFRDASREMLRNAVETDVFQGTLRVRVLRPEDLVGLKLQAMRNNPARQPLESQDIAALLAVCGEELDRTAAERYARLLDMESVYQDILKGLSDERS